MKSECDESREAKRHQEQQSPELVKPLPPILPALPLQGEAEDNLDRREEYFQKRHSR